MSDWFGLACFVMPWLALPVLGFALWHLTRADHDEPELPDWEDLV